MGILDDLNSLAYLGVMICAKYFILKQSAADNMWMVHDIPLGMLEMVQFCPCSCCSGHEQG